jgi:hypothetical protein
VNDRGWKGIKNGELLRLAEGQFDLFITADQSIRYQQYLGGRRIPMFAPIVTAKIVAANNVKSGVLASMRAPMRMSFISPSDYDSGEPDEVH